MKPAAVEVQSEGPTEGKKKKITLPASETMIQLMERLGPPH